MIVVVGAGIAGLASALALAEAGEVLVLERRSRIAANAGAGIQLSPNAVKALRSLGAADGVAASAHPPDGLVVRTAAPDASVVRLSYRPLMEERYGASYLTASRLGLHDALSACVAERGIEIRYDAVVTTVREDGGGCIVDGCEGRADLVIAADGVNSAVRRAVVGDAPRPTGWVAWRGRGHANGADTELVLGSGHHLVRYALNDREANCVLIASERGRGVTGVARTPTGRLMADVADWTPWPIAVRPHHAFARGRVGFVGDSAHAMLPFLAQGAAMALEDAAVLAVAVAAHGPTPHALAHYAATRRARTVAIAAKSQRQGSIYHLPFPFDRARNLAMRRLGPDAILARVDPIYGWTPP